MIGRFLHRRMLLVRKRGESGQALVETAMTISLLLLILLGAVEFARFAYMGIEISNATKAAAQYGSQNAAYAGDITGIGLSAQKDAPYTYSQCSNFTTSVQNSGGQLPCTCVTNGTPSPMPPSYAACTATCAGYPVEVLVITTSASCSTLFHGNGFPGNLTLSRTAVQEVLN